MTIEEELESLQWEYMSRMDNAKNCSPDWRVRMVEEKRINKQYENETELLRLKLEKKAKICTKRAKN